MATKRTLKIDGRSPQARALNLSGASFDMAGNVTGGKDTLTRAAVTTPARPMRDIYRTAPPAPSLATGTPAAESGRGRIRSASTPDPVEPAPQAPQFRKPTVGPIMGDALGDSSRAAASTAAMRESASLRNARNAEDAVYQARAEKALSNSARATPTLVDMRPAKYRPEMQTHPDGELYREQNEKVMREQHDERENTAQEDRFGDYHKRQSDAYRTTEARARTDAAMRGPDMTGKLPADTRRVALTDPKYGGSGFGFSRQALRIPQPARMPNPSLPALAVDKTPFLSVPTRPLPANSAAVPRQRETPSEPKEVEPAPPPSPIMDGVISDSNYPKKVQYRRKNGRLVSS